MAGSGAVGKPHTLTGIGQANDVEEMGRPSAPYLAGAARFQYAVH